MIKDELLVQMDQSWMILREIVRDTGDDVWTHAGCGYVTPARTAFHILLGVEYYIGYVSNLSKRFGKDWEKMPDESLPSQADILTGIGELRNAMVEWVEGLDLDAENPRFPWAGETMAGVLLFALRHTMYHIGELNALLYHHRGGDVEDYWMKGFQPFDTSL
jgi:hypothetical protein